MFVDEAFIRIQSGKGGDGCLSFRREKFAPRGGPDGGDGGDGGNVILRADPQICTLAEVARRVHFRAANGSPGSGANKTGRDGADLEIAVPVGTVAREAPADGGDRRQGAVLADLSRPDQAVVLARGGRGGRGNKFFATATNQVPREVEDGGPAVEREVYLELKLLADIGLIGLPNAGKSTLLSRLSAARPRIAAYPFTTLHPNLGIAELGLGRRLIFADIPGLIEGAHRGHGLGIEFLRHVERTRALVHLLSLEEPTLEGLAQRFRVIEAELAGFNPELARKPRLVALSKADLLPAAEAADLATLLGPLIGARVQLLSSVTGFGLEELLAACDRLVRETQAGAPASGN